MNDVTLSKNLHQLMRIHGNLSVTELAKLTQIPQPTLHHILSGSTKNPRKKSLDALANFFHISIPQLTGEKPLPRTIPESVKKNLKIKTVPIIPWDMLKDWPSVDLKNFHLNEILLEKTVANDSFALRLEDSSMEPLFPQKALLIFDYDKPPKDRDFVIVIGQNNNILFNRLFIDNDERYIKQNLKDGHVKLIKLEPNVYKIVGTLIEVRIEY